MTSKNKLEVCCCDIESVIAAKEGGADRIELCSALEVGGLTPSLGLIKEAVKHFGDGVFVLVRERPGDFVYSPLEINVMAEDIKLAVKEGVSGIVIGALTEDGNIDTAATRVLIEAAGDLPITFHRAFDLVKDPINSLEKIIELGCHRILTSGQKESAETGIPLLKQLNDKAGNRIVILAGAGVTSENAAKILKETGGKEIHASAKIMVGDHMRSSSEKVKEIKKEIS